MDPISHHVQKVGPGDALKTLKTECLSSINSKSDGFVAELEQALVQDNFDAVAAVLTSCEQFCLHLNEYVLPKNKDRLTFGVIEKTRAHTERNRDRALEIIKGKMFNEELASLLDAIQRGSQNETMLRHVRLCLEGEHPAGENDYNEVTTAMANAINEEGNALHNEGKYSEAAEKYQAAKQNLHGNASASAQQVKMSCCLNLASCYLKTGQHDLVVEECSNVIQMDTKNLKALYRRGQAYAAMGRHSMAERS